MPLIMETFEGWIPLPHNAGLCRILCFFSGIQILNGATETTKVFLVLCSFNQKG